MKSVAFPIESRFLGEYYHPISFPEECPVCGDVAKNVAVLEIKWYTLGKESSTEFKLKYCDKHFEAAAVSQGSSSSISGGRIFIVLGGFMLIGCIWDFSKTPLYLWIATFVFLAVGIGGVVLGIRDRNKHREEYNEEIKRRKALDVRIKPSLRDPKYFVVDCERDEYAQHLQQFNLSSKILDTGK